MTVEIMFGETPASDINWRNPDEPDGDPEDLATQEDLEMNDRITGFVWPEEEDDDEDEDDPVLTEAVAEDAGSQGFTGTITDKLGRKRHYVDGKQVAGQKESGGGDKQKEKKTDDGEGKRHQTTLGKITSKVKNILTGATGKAKAAVKKAKSLGAKAMSAIENRYGKKVRQAVSIAVIAALPIPLPGMSVIMSAPIIAAAELYRQAFAESIEDGDRTINYGNEAIRKLAKHVIEQLYGGKIPDEIADQIDL